MRPGFMVMVIIVIVLAFIVLFSIIDFVLTNRVMFETTFDIVIKVPGWSHTWEGVQFMYILAGSFLLGAVVIAVITLGLDTKRTLKLRSIRKELKHLQEALQNAQQSLQEKETQAEKEQPPIVEEELDEEPVEMSASASITPEEITKSFEDTVQKSDFLEKPKKRREEGQGDEDENEKESGVWGTEDAVTEKEEIEPEPSEEKIEDSTPDRDKELLEETPVEAEVVEHEELAEEQESGEKVSKQEKEEEEEEDFSDDHVKKKGS